MDPIMKFVIVAIIPAILLLGSAFIISEMPMGRRKERWGCLLTFVLMFGGPILLIIALIIKSR
jgi:hypothetical protein